MIFDLILQNNASKEFKVYSGLENLSPHHLYFEFAEVELDIPEGEYTYVLIKNERDDVEYDFKTPILDTIVKTSEGDVMLRNLRPIIGLFKNGSIDIPVDNVYDESNNNSIFYYEG